MNSIQKALISYRLNDEKAIKVGDRINTPLESDENNIDFEKGIYVDNAFNRMLKRVGMTYCTDVPNELQEYRNTDTASIHKINGQCTPERIKSIPKMRLTNVSS